MFFRPKNEEDSFLSVEEFMDKIEETLDIEDVDSLVSCIPYLRRLNNNQNIIKDTVGAYLRSILDGCDVMPAVTPQSLQIAASRSDRFYVRFNMWNPISPSAQSRQYQQHLYALELPHDHNFTFLTIGNFGPGYTTDTFEYSRERVKGEVGESVELRPTGSYQLGPGDVMLYREGRDAHVQHEPASLSISINIMLRTKLSRSGWQYFFDTDTSRIIAKGGGAVVSQRSILEMAAQVGDEEIFDLMKDISKHTESQNIQGFVRDVLKTREE